MPVQGKSVVYSTKPKWRTEARKGGGAATTDYIHAEGQTASESVEQQALFRWAAFAAGKYPELRLLYHVPNEGKRSQWTGARMRSEGLKSGVPDLCLPVARSGYHGLYIEMKAGKNKPTANQLAWLEALEAQGYKTAVCYGWEAAKNVIEAYLKSGEEKMKSVKKDFGGYICRNEKCVYRIKVDGKRDLCPFKGCIFSKRGRSDEHNRA